MNAQLEAELRSYISVLEHLLVVDGHVQLPEFKYNKNLLVDRRAREQLINTREEIAKHLQK